MCGEEFRRQHHAQAKYCSDRCKGRAHREGLSDPNHPSQRRYHGGSPKNWPPSKIAVYPTALRHSQRQGFSPRAVSSSSARGA